MKELDFTILFSEVSFYLILFGYSAICKYIIGNLKTDSIISKIFFSIITPLCVAVFAPIFGSVMDKNLSIYIALVFANFVYVYILYQDEKNNYAQNKLIEFLSKNEYAIYKELELVIDNNDEIEIRTPIQIETLEELYERIDSK